MNNVSLTGRLTRERTTADIMAAAIEMRRRITL